MTNLASIWEVNNWP